MASPTEFDLFEADFKELLERNILNKPKIYYHKRLLQYIVFEEICL